MGGGAVFVSASSGTLWGGSLEGVGSGLGCGRDSSELELSGPASCLAGGLLVGNAGGGMGRLAEGASGTSSGFCCDQPVPANRKTSAPNITAPLFFTISRTHTFFSQNLAENAQTALYEMPARAALVHLSSTG